MTKICKTCIFCKRLFRRFGYELSPENFYLCEKHANFTEPEKTCKGWRQKTDTCDLSSARFRQAEEDIKAIVSLLR